MQCVVLQGTSVTTLAMSRMSFLLCVACIEPTGHGGQQIAEIIIDVAKEYAFVGQPGVFVGDNAESNDVAWRETLKALHPDCDPQASRSRCLGHIINLAAKAVLFGKHVRAFEAIVDIANDAIPNDSPAMRNAQNDWRAKGPIGKAHNIVLFIRCSPQRRETFKRCVVGDVSDAVVNAPSMAPL